MLVGEGQLEVLPGGVISGVSEGEINVGGGGQHGTVEIVGDVIGFENVHVGSGTGALGIMNVSGALIGTGSGSSIRVGTTGGATIWHLEALLLGMASQVSSECYLGSVVGPFSWETSKEAYKSQAEVHLLIC